MTPTDKDYELFLEYLHKGVLLLDKKEFDDYHFDIDTNSLKVKELATLVLKEGVNHDNYFNKIEPKASEILKEFFNEQKEKDLCNILSKIETDNPDDLELRTTTSASRLFLEDKQTEHHHLPLAVTRLIEDVYSTVSKK